MLGGMNGQERFTSLQNNINDMIKIGVDIDNKKESYHYKQLLNNIICNNVHFNKPSETEESEQTAGSASLDLIVDKHLGNGRRVVLIIQRVKRFGVSDILIGVLAIGIKTNNRWFVIDKSVIRKRRGKPN
jgi:hypothetical protein